MGFTLVEILISVTIMVLAITSTLQILNYLIQLQEANDIALLCMNVAQGYMDEVREMNYEDIIGNCNNETFSLNELTNRNIQHCAVAYAAEIEPGDLTEVKVVICYKVKNRTYGEDKNFNGLLDAGEDANGNGQIDSSCSVSTVIANR